VASFTRPQKGREPPAAGGNTANHQGERGRNKLIAWAAPLLFAAYPAFQITAHNIEHVSPLGALRPLLLGLLLAGSCLIILRGLGWQWLQAGLGALLLVVFVLSYGQIYQSLKAAHPILSNVVRHRFLLPISLLVLTAALIVVARWRPPVVVLSVLAIAGGLGLGQPAIVLGADAWRATRPATEPFADELICRGLEATWRPDIYLIVLDAYERHDVLLEAHSFDNTPFLAELEQLGFSIGYGSLSNYRYTAPSMASLLNMSYVQDLPQPAPQSWVELSRTIRQPRIRSELECLGYEVIAFDSGVAWTSWPDADQFRSQEPNWLHRIGLLGPISRIEAILLERSLALAVLDAVQTSARQLPSWLDPTQEHVGRIHFTFEELAAVAGEASPKFVYAHIVSPHPPMVLGQDRIEYGAEAFERAFAGQPGQASGDYAAQVDYLNQLVVTSLRQIIERSSQPPIIILTGDHGWADDSPEQKLSILHAYLLPGKGAAFYPTITPVNTFRLVLRQYFGADLPLLEDRSYYSEGRDLQNFEAVENTWRPRAGD
jgi:hypothetical protein